jgi:hypothetical protein
VMIMHKRVPERVEMLDHDLAVGEHPPFDSSGRIATARCPGMSAALVRPRVFTHHRRHWRASLAVIGQALLACPVCWRIRQVSSPGSA